MKVNGFIIKDEEAQLLLELLTKHKDDIGENLTEMFGRLIKAYD